MTLWLCQMRKTIDFFATKYPKDFVTVNGLIRLAYLWEENLFYSLNNAFLRLYT